jgi:predicted HAD superfamily Cof-like phosphohydrolase
MTKEQKAVRDFMRFFGQATPERPTPLDEETSKLRATLILEEAFETITKGLGLTVVVVDDFGGEAKVSEAGLKQISFQFKKEKETDLVELADGVADIGFVSEGTAVAAGIDMEPIHTEVARSNASKLWSVSDVSRGGIDPDADVITAGDGKYIVKRGDGKIVKSPSYSPADIAGEIEKQLK